MEWRSLLGCGLAAGFVACATAGRLPPPDLTPARAALEEARAAGAQEKARDSYAEAQGQLQEAERLASTQSPEAREAALRAEWMARLARTQALCATAVKNAEAVQAAQEEKAAKSEEAERLAARLRRSEEEQHRLEERLALQHRELEVTETELIRTKARLKGIETRAEASSAIAEARILLRRLDPKSRAPILSLCQDSLAKAEQQLQQENYGAAVFFAMKAQDLAAKAQEDTSRRPSSSGSDQERPAPKKRYLVKAKKANIRGAPGLDEPVVGEALQGASLEASAVRGEWVKVTYAGVTGWVHVSLIE